MMTTYKMWENTPGTCTEEPVLKHYKAKNKTTDATAIVFPGGAYAVRATHEGEGYAEYFNSCGMDAFVCEYRVTPAYFPLPLLDARRAVRYVRAHAVEFGVNPDKIAVVGSSAGGHLAALLSTYTDSIDFEDTDEVDRINPLPNATVLCYPVIHAPDDMNVSHIGSFQNLLGSAYGEREKFSPDLLVTDSTPTAFIWHTSMDDTVNVMNSYLYAKSLREHGIPHELHVFPNGWHGLGLAEENPHVAQWKGLLMNWFKNIGFTK